MRIAGIHNLGLIAPKNRMALTNMDQMDQVLEDPPLNGLRIMAPFGSFPIEFGTVNPTAIVKLLFILLVAVIIERPQLITEIEQRHATNAEDNVVDEQNTADCQLYRVLSLGFKGLLQAGQGSAAPVDPAILGYRVVVEQQPGGEAGGKLA